MSIMSIFKKMFEQKEEKQEVQIKQISLSEIPYTTQELLKEKKSNLEELKKTALSKVEKFRFDLEMDIRVLGNINLDSRKENEKLKRTVLDNLRLYTDYLKNLIKDLD